MRHAFIILAHKNPEQLLRLLHRLSHPQMDAYIHLDAKVDKKNWEQVFEHPQTYYVTDRISVTWAGYGTIAAALKGIESVRKSGKQYEYIHLISAQDYPLASADDIYKYFKSNGRKQFLDILPSASLRPMMKKITQWHFEDWKIPGKYRVTQLINKILPDRKHPLGLEVFGGSLWWSLSSDCAFWCLDYINQHPQLKRFYKYTWGGDEFIFQIVIMNSHFRQQVHNDYLRYVDWSEGHAHPKILTREDLPAILKSGKLFARKFDAAKAPEVLDAIDQNIKKQVLNQGQTIYRDSSKL
jgi:hypothetical protein